MFDIPILEALKLPLVDGELCFDLGCDRLVGNDLDWDTDMGLVVEGGGEEAKYSTASVPDSKSSTWKIKIAWCYDWEMVIVSMFDQK